MSSPASESISKRDAVTDYGDDPSRHGGPIGRAELPDGYDAGPLKSKGSRVGKLIGVSIGCLLWNGIVGVIAVSMLKSGSKLPLLFLFPFGVVGLVLVGALIRQCLAMFNPVPIVEVSRPVLHLGDTFELSWSFSGSTHRISTLSVNLELLEWVQYRRGTDTVTKEEKLIDISIGEFERSDLGHGSAEVTVPADAMHTFGAKSNRFLWKLRFRADIPRWPDIDETYDVFVLPHGFTPSPEDVG